MDINVNINIDSGAEPKVEVKKENKVKVRKRKLKNGKETVLELPDRVETEAQTQSPILNMMGV